MLEFLFEIVAEFVLQIVVEGLAELGLHMLAEPFRRTPKPWLAVIGYAVFGVAAGALSLWPFPHHFVREPALRILNLVVTPILVGLVMSLMGAWRARRGQRVLRIDRFAYGYVFALSFAFIRFKFAG